MNEHVPDGGEQEVGLAEQQGAQVVVRNIEPFDTFHGFDTGENHIDEPIAHRIQGDLCPHAHNLSPSMGGGETRALKTGRAEVSA